MTILVAGKTGLVGSAILRGLNKAGRAAVGINSKDVNLLDRKKTFEYIQDLKPTLIIDAAARVGGIGANSNFPVDFLSENLQIQCNLMDAAHVAKVEKFVFLGSSCIYPKFATQPLSEGSLLTGVLEESNSAYAIAKIAGIELIKSYRKQFGHNWISLMPTNLYGPYDNFDLENSHVLPALIRKFIDAKNANSDFVTLWGSGTPLRDFMHVDDLSEAVIFCSEKFNENEHINIGSGQEISINNLAVLISKIVGFTGRIEWDKSRLDGTPRKVLDVSKLESYGWTPKISLENGIRDTVKWY
ncbi:MAG: GDP-L-fucose synthase, partial [Actinobacteria bacterium]|nr:GDP-L-fucose synthase [Actinomycetota bacterium]